MRRKPHMSTGAWIFAGLVSAAVIAPTAVYAAVNSTVAIGTKSNTVTANVTPNRQLLTATVATRSVVRGSLFSDVSGQCGSTYTPPAGKAIVLSQVTYGLGSGTDGVPRLAILMTADCGAGYDTAETSLARETQSHVFPIGLPMPSVRVYNNGGQHIQVSFTGYLIPVSELP